MLKTVLRGFVFGLAALCSLALAQTINSSVQLSQDPRGVIGVDTNSNVYLQSNRHLLTSVNAAAAPTLGTCTGGTLVAGSTDMSGAVSGTSGTSCAVNFGTAYLTAPRCVTAGSISLTTTGPVSNTTSTTVLTMTVAATGAGVWSWVCMSNS